MSSQPIPDRSEQPHKELRASGRQQTRKNVVVAFVVEAVGTLVPCGLGCTNRKLQQRLRAT